MIDAQVLILGAGPGGCATALALLGAGVEGVVLVNKPARTPFRIGESATPDVSNLLKRLGLSASLSQAGHCEYHANLSLWGGVRRIDDFLRRGKGHGWHLDRAAFDESLRRAAIDRGARLFSPATAADLARRDGAWQVGVDLGGTARERVRALVLVDAAGRRAPLACRLGATRYRIDRMVALAHVAPACSGLAGLVLTEPFAEGWWYAAKRPDDRAIVTLMTDADIARRRGWRHWACYREAWEETAELRLRVPPPQRESLVATFPAHSGFTDRAAGAGWIAVGDAIISFDPLTSSGIAGVSATPSQPPRPSESGWTGPPIPPAPRQPTAAAPMPLSSATSPSAVISMRARPAGRRARSGPVATAGSGCPASGPRKVCPEYRPNCDHSLRIRRR